jgi:hypothetical protein
MATLQATTVATSLDVEFNKYARLGDAYVSSGGSLANFGFGCYFTTTWTGTGPALQLDSTAFKFLNVTGPSTTTTIFSITNTLTTVSSTSTSFITGGGNNTTNSTVGIGEAAGTAAADGKLKINAGGTGKPFLEVTNCAGDSASATKTVRRGWLAIKIGSSVGATAVTAGTYYIELFNAT